MRMPRVNGSDTVAALVRAGCVVHHRRGSHVYLKTLAGRLVTVPVHGRRILKPATLRSILDQAGLSIEEFTELSELGPQQHGAGATAARGRALDP
jgi:predicted RNA binding protein YcfA (HicA-like mRNA interferase family)